MAPDIPGATWRVLPGLPPYGPLATSFPLSFAATGQEGFVVEFLPDSPGSWVGNFREGSGSYTHVHRIPHGRDVVVFAKGRGYVVDVDQRDLKVELVGDCSYVWEV